MPTMELKDNSDKELIDELERRGKTISAYTTCPSCKKWTVYMGCSRSWRKEPHCFGCRQPIENCNCSR